MPLVHRMAREGSSMDSQRHPHASVEKQVVAQYRFIV